MEHKDKIVFYGVPDRIEFVSETQDFVFFCMEHGHLISSSSTSNTHGKMGDIRWFVKRHYKTMHATQEERAAGIHDPFPRTVVAPAKAVMDEVLEGHVERDEGEFRVPANQRRNVVSAVYSLNRKNGDGSPVYRHAYWHKWGLDLQMRGARTNGGSESKTTPATSSASLTSSEAAAPTTRPRKPQATTALNATTSATAAAKKVTRAPKKFTQVDRFMGLHLTVPVFLDCVLACKENMNSASAKRAFLASADAIAPRSPNRILCDTHWKETMEELFSHIKELHFLVDALEKVKDRYDRCKAAYESRVVQSVSTVQAVRKAKFEQRLREHKAELDQMASNERAGIVELAGGQSMVVLMSTLTPLPKKKNTDKALRIVAKFEKHNDHDYNQELWKRDWGIQFNASNWKKTGHCLHLEPKVQRLCEALERCQTVIAANRDLKQAGLLSEVYVCARAIASQSEFVIAYEHSDMYTREEKYGNSATVAAPDRKSSSWTSSMSPSGISSSLLQNSASSSSSSTRSTVNAVTTALLTSGPPSRARAAQANVSTGANIFQSTASSSSSSRAPSSKRKKQSKDGASAANNILGNFTGGQFGRQGPAKVAKRTEKQSQKQAVNAASAAAAAASAAAATAPRVIRDPAEVVRTAVIYLGQLQSCAKMLTLLRSKNKEMVNSGAEFPSESARGRK